MSVDPFALGPSVPVDVLALDRVGEDLRERFSLLFLEPDFSEATTHQRVSVGFACSFLRFDPSQNQVFSGEIEKLFAVINKGIKRHFKKNVHGSKAPHRPRILTDEALA
jgi:hypothetical protein